MEQAIEKISEWAKTGENLATPSWQDLPAIPLYMDQVIFYLKDCLAFFERDENSPLLTSSMINNYVKNSVIPHPEKKKYSKEHLGALMAVCMLKQVLSMQDIKTLFNGREIDSELYGLFKEVHSDAVKETCRSLHKSRENGENPRETALRLAVEANAKRAAAERILCELAAAEKKK